MGPGNPKADVSLTIIMLRLDVFSKSVATKPHGQATIYRPAQALYAKNAPQGEASSSIPR